MQNLDSTKQKPRSISRTLSAGLIITLVLVAGLSLGVNFILSARKAKAELETRADEYISALADGLKVPLWNYSEETIAAICASYAQNEFVAKLLLEDQKGAVLFRKEKVDQRTVVSRSRDIFYEGNRIGRVQIALASGYYTAVNQQLFESFGLTIVIMIGALLVLTGVLLRQFLKKPMSRFIKMVDAYAAGQPDAFKQGIAYREFDPLVDVLDNMGEKIASQMKSLKLIQYAVDHSSVATYWISPDGRIRYVNAAACRSLGYLKDEFVKLPVAEIDPLWRAERWSGLVEKIKSQGSLTFESVHRRKDGSTFPVEVTATFLTFEEAGYIFAFVADITQRKQSEEEIRKLNEDLERRVEERTAELKKLSETVEQSPVTVMITDKNGTIEYVNPRFTKVTGYSFDEAVGQNLSVLIAGIQSAEFYKNLWETIKAGRVWEGEFSNKKKNGNIFWENATISPLRNKDEQITHFVAVKEDITERKEVEKKLKESEEQHRMMLERLPESVVVYDMEGKAIFVNPAFENIFGWSREEVLGRKIDFVPPEHEAETRLAIQKMIAADAETMFFVSRRLTKHGDLLDVQINIAPFYDRNGLQAGNVVILNNITERKRAEELIKNSEQRLAQIINFLPDPTWVIDSAGKVVTWNQAMENLTGIAAADMVGKGNYEYALPFYGERRPILIDLVREWNPEYEKKYLSIKKEGNKLVSESHHPNLGDGGMYLSGNASPIYDAAGQVAGAIESLRDITERKHMEEDLRQNVEELERFNKLAIGREIKMIQLKEEINELMIQSGKVEKYKIVS